MVKRQGIKFRFKRLFSKVNIILIFALICFGVSELPAVAQTFNEIKKSLVDYSKADIKPAEPCEAMGSFKTQPGMPSADFGLAQDTMRYLVHNPPKPEYDCSTFDFDKDIHMLDAWGKLADAKNPDLSRFRKRGGKLLMTYGWSDPILQPVVGINYYEEALEVNGPDTPDFFRLFMVPGMSHCSGGECPNQFDPVTAIVNWVEKGKAPEKIIAKQIKNGKVVRTRPLCPYPEVAKYKGKGSIDEADNFECKAP